VRLLILPLVHSGGRWSLSARTGKLENRVVLQVAEHIAAWLRATRMPNHRPQAARYGDHLIRGADWAVFDRGRLEADPVTVIGLVYVPYIARPLRGQVLALREQPFVEAALACGLRPLRVMFSELLPHLWTTTVTGRVRASSGSRPTNDLPGCGSHPSRDGPTLSPALPRSSNRDGAA
jgi:Binding-protein-dependent transport system inner membrane component